MWGRVAGMDVTEVDRWMEEAVGHHRAGRLREAEAGYRRVLSGDSGHADALHLLGLVAIQVGKAGVAIELIERAIGRRPGFASALSNLGYAYQMVGRWGDAIGAYRKALEIVPELAEARLNLGNALVESGRAEEALGELVRVVELRAGDANAHNSLGTAFRALRRTEEAAAAFEKALLLDANHAEAHNNLGNALRVMDRQDEAIAHLERAISLRPDYGQSMNNLGGAFEELGEYERAIETYRKAIAVQPQLHMAHVNLGIALLRNGDFANGWAEYEHRYRDPEIAPLLRKSDRPIWDGTDIAGQTILLHAEQGLGDTIQFVRYAPKVKERSRHVILRCLPSLLPLLRGIGGVDELISIDDLIPAHDVQCPLMSLPRIFGTELGNIPAKVPYFHADSSHVPKWGERLAEYREKVKVGLCWAGRAQYANDHRRSIPAERLADFGEIPGMQFVSLQKERNDQGILGLAMIDCTDELSDFAETAALVDGLDLVISVDTSIAHLAGAMGKPVWVLLPFMPDWRWLRDREDSPWYPTARLFRQKSRGDWAEVIARVREALTTWRDPSPQ